MAWPKPVDCRPTAQESYEMLQALLANIGSGVAVYEVLNYGAESSDYIVREMNAAGLELIGGTEKEVLGRSLLELQADIDGYGAIPALRRVWRTGRPEAWFPAKPYTDTNGKEHWFENRLAKLPNGRVLSVYNDVSQAREAEASRLLDHLMATGSRDALLAISAVTGIILDANPVAEVSYGYSREELLNLGIDQLRSVAGGPLDRERLVAAGDEGLLYETEHRRRDGSSFPVEVSVHATSLADGSAVLLAVVRDISERKRADEQLRFTSSIVEQAGELVFWMTADGALAYVNAATTKTLGYSREDLCAMTIHDIDPEFPAERWPRHMQELEAAGSLTFETHHRAKDGTLVPMEVTALYMEHGGEAYDVGFARDISKRRAAERELQRSLAMLSHGESLAHLGSWEWDVASRTFTASEGAQRLMGLAGDHFTDEELGVTFHEDDRAMMLAALADAAAGRALSLQHRIVRPDTGEVRHLKSYGQPLFDTEGRVASVIGASLDVTERVRAEGALLEREQRLERALAGTVTALGATVALRDPYTGEHERRVAKLACVIAERLGWSEGAVARLSTAARVHDIGKIIVPAEILTKPSRLSEAEFALIKGHPQAAYEVLAEIEFGGPVAEIVLQHHERLDGSGYPQGLSGEEILPGARVLAVADVIEAMVSHRPYRPALPLEAAFAEIEGGAGSRYDADVCAAALALFRDEGLDLPE